MQATQRPWEERTDLTPGQYAIRPDKRMLVFVLPSEMEQGYRHAGGLNRVGLGPGAWTLASEDPISVMPSIWIQPHKGHENGEWHGFLHDGQFKQA